MKSHNSARTPSLHTLPNELHLQIFTHLPDHPSRAAYTLTTRRFYILLNSDLTRLAISSHILPKPIHILILHHLPDYKSRNAYIRANHRLHLLLKPTLYHLAINDPRFIDRAFLFNLRPLAAVFLETFLAAGLPINKRLGWGRTLLISAAKNGNWDMSRQLLLHGADATLVDGAGRTALHCAAVSSNGCEESLDVIQMLAGQKGVHVNTREIRGFTPLFLALEKEYIVTGVVERLLLLGADPNIANFKGRMPLGWVHPKYNDGVYMSDAHVRRLRRLLLKYGAVGDPEPRSASSCGIF